MTQPVAKWEDDTDLKIGLDPEGVAIHPPGDAAAVEQLTTQQRKILERTERKVAALGAQNSAVLAEFHKITGNRYVPERLYVPASGE